MTEDREPEEAGRQDERDEYESPEVVVLGRVEDLTSGLGGQGADAFQEASVTIF